MHIICIIDDHEYQTYPAVKGLMYYARYKKYDPQNISIVIVNTSTIQNNDIKDDIEQSRSSKLKELSEINNDKIEIRLIEVDANSPDEYDSYISNPEKFFHEISQQLSDLNFQNQETTITYLLDLQLNEDMDTTQIQREEPCLSMKLYDYIENTLDDSNKCIPFTSYSSQNFKGDWSALYHKKWPDRDSPEIISRVFLTKEHFNLEWGEKIFEG